METTQISAQTTQVSAVANLKQIYSKEAVEKYAKEIVGPRYKGCGAKVLLSKVPDLEAFFDERKDNYMGRRSEKDIQDIEKRLVSGFNVRTYVRSTYFILLLIFAFIRTMIVSLSLAVMFVS